MLHNASKLVCILCCCYSEYVGQNAFDLAGDREDLLQALRAPRPKNTLVIDSAENGMHHGQFATCYFVARKKIFLSHFKLFWELIFQA